MTTTNTGSGTNVHEIATGIYRINTPVPPSMIPGGFSFNQYLPHGWETGYFFDQSTRTLLCGDLFTQPGSGETPVTGNDILEPSEAFREKMDYFSHSKNAPALLESLAMTDPGTLACMHGSVWQGDGAALLRALSGRLSGA